MDIERGICYWNSCNEVYKKKKLADKENPPIGTYKTLLFDNLFLLNKETFMKRFIKELILKYKLLHMLNYGGRKEVMLQLHDWNYLFENVKPIWDAYLEHDFIMDRASNEFREYTQRIDL